VTVDARSSSPDAIVVGAGLAGLVAAHELTRAGRQVALLDRVPQALGLDGTPVDGL
jgi:monoamine oxidase